MIYKRDSRKYCEKNLRRNIFVISQLSPKKIRKKKFSPNKKLIEKNFRKSNFSKKKNSKKILKIILAIFLYLKKKFEKRIAKILKIIVAIFLYLKKKSVKSRLIVD